jgi:hypothetical protein
MIKYAVLLSRYKKVLLYFIVWVILKRGILVSQRELSEQRDIKLKNGVWNSTYEQNYYILINYTIKHVLLSHFGSSLHYNTV